MSVSIKSAKEIQLMREAGKRLELVHSKLEEYVKQHHEKERDFSFEREDLADGTVVYHVNTSGLLQRYTFTEI